MTGAGHSPEQVMLYSKADNFVLFGDQVLAKISPNVSVEAMDPEGDPLGAYLRSLERLKRALPEDVLVLPGHRLPFVGLHTRADELIAHHEARCMAIVEACKRDRRRWPNSCRSFSGARSTIRTSSSSPSARRWRM